MFMNQDRTDYYKKPLSVLLKWGDLYAVLNANKTIWQVGDEIAVYSGGDAPVKFTSIEEGSKAKFTTDQEVSGSSSLLAYPFGAAMGIEH